MNISNTNGIGTWLSNFYYYSFHPLTHQCLQYLAFSVDYPFDQTRRCLTLGDRPETGETRWSFKPNWNCVKASLTNGFPAPNPCSTTDHNWLYALCLKLSFVQHVWFKAQVGSVGVLEKCARPCVQQVLASDLSKQTYSDKSNLTY